MLYHFIIYYPKLRGEHKQVYYVVITCDLNWVTEKGDYGDIFKQ